MQNNENSYVYVYCDPRRPGDYNYGGYHFDYEPFYVGKGTGKRWHDHIKYSKSEDEKYHSNKYKVNKIRKITEDGFDMSAFVIFPLWATTAMKASLYEIELIALCGRLDAGTGKLVNLTDGGEGLVGHIMSFEHKAKLSASQTLWRQNNPLTPEQKQVLSTRRKQWVEDNPNEHTAAQLKASTTRRALKTRTANSIQRKQWIQDNPEKHTELQRKAAGPKNTPEYREKNSKRVTEWYVSHPEAKKNLATIKKQWYKDNPELAVEVHQKVAMGVRKKLMLTKPIRDNCKDLRERYNLNIKFIGSQSSFEKWVAFELYLKTTISAQ